MIGAANSPNADNDSDSHHPTRSAYPERVGFLPGSHLNLYFAEIQN